MPVDPVALDRTRAWLLARTLAALATVDPNRMAVTWWPAARVVADSIAQAQQRTIGAVEREWLHTLDDAVGMVLGWDVTGLAEPAMSATEVASHLGAVPRLVEARVVDGAEPAAALRATSTWVTQQAGSVVHETARQCVAAASDVLPVFSGWRWVPEAGACPWCRMQASRGAVFREDTVRHSHAHCRCDAVEVVDRAEARRVREHGREQWRAMLASGDVPARQWVRGLPTSPTSGLTAPGAGTPQRLVAVRAQIASYERHPATGEHGRDCQQRKLTELRAELLTLAS